MDATDCFTLLVNAFVKWSKKRTKLYVYHQLQIITSQSLQIKEEKKEETTSGANVR